MLAGVVDDLDDVAYAQVRVVVPFVALAITGFMAALIAAAVLLPAVPVVVSAVVVTVLVAATGLDALVTERANNMSWPKGQLRYPLAAIAAANVPPEATTAPG